MRGHEYITQGGGGGGGGVKVLVLVETDMDMHFVLPRDIIGTNCQGTEVITNIGDISVGSNINVIIPTVNSEYGLQLVLLSILR